MIGEISISFQKQNDMKEIEESPIWENIWFERSILRHASLMTLSHLGILMVSIYPLTCQWDELPP